MNKISIGITTHNSAEYVIKQLNLDYLSRLSSIVDEIVIQDDCSIDYNILKKYETHNIKVFTNPYNMSPLLNRVELLKKCKNDWVMLIDSDNSISITSEDGSLWTDIVSKFDLDDKQTIYSPGFVKHCGYNKILEEKMDFNFFKTHFNDPSYYLQMLGNTGNYLVPKNEYIKISQQIDSRFCHFIGEVLYFNYLWLKSGNYLICKKNFEYNHTIRNDSYTITNFQKSLETLKEIYSFFD